MFQKRKLEVKHLISREFKNTFFNMMRPNYRIIGEAPSYRNVPGVRQVFKISGLTLITLT